MDRCNSRGALRASADPVPANVPDTPPGSDTARYVFVVAASRFVAPVAAAARPSAVDTDSPAVVVALLIAAAAVARGALAGRVAVAVAATAVVRGLVVADSVLAGVAALPGCADFVAGCDSAVVVAPVLVAAD